MSRLIAGHFRSLSVLHDGGPGTVHEAEDTRLGRRVALRVVSSDDADEATRETMLAAARAAASLNHPGIATLYEAGHDEVGGVYIASELVEGRPLSELIAEGPQKPDRACRLLDGLAAALDHAHARGVVHGRLAPASVVITAEGRPRILDFGLAAAMRGTSPGHTAPEQLAGHPPDELTDLWSLGAIFHELLTGQPPAAAADPRPVAAANPRAAFLQEPLVDRLLARERERRLPSAAAVQQAIAALDPELLRPTHRRRRRVLMTAAVAVLVVAAWFGGRSMRPVDRPVPSVAVLPLQIDTDDEELQELAAGFSGEVIRSLAQVAELRVIAQSSTRNLAGTALSLAQIADTLGVDNVVRGRLQLVDGNLRISAELRDARGDRLLWSDRYDADASEALMLQASVARAVAARVKGRLSEREKEALTESRTIDPAAYRAYLKGVAQLETWGLFGVWWRAEGLLVDAIELEPGFAPAWAELARAWCFLSWFFPEERPWMAREKHPTLENRATVAQALGLAPEVWYQELAAAAAARALELDSELATAHTVTGMLRWMADLDWDGAEAAFTRALELAPGDGFTHRQYANYLTLDGRCDQAEAEAAAAVRLSPLSLANKREYIAVLANCHRFEEAREAVLALYPTYRGNRDIYHLDAIMMHIAIWKGEPQQVAVWADSLAAHTQTGRSAAPGYWYLGDKDRAWELMGGREDYVKNITATYMLMLEDRRDEALTILETWAEESPARGMVIMLDPYFDPLHEDPRWKAMVEKLKMRRFQ